MTPVLILVLASCRAIGALECNNTVAPESYTSFPSPYDGEVVISPRVAGCELSQLSMFECVYSVVLGDGVGAPSPPDLTSSVYLSHFIAWNRDSMYSYVHFTFAEEVQVTVVELSFLNYPVKRISLPNVELTGTMGSSFTIPYAFSGNSELTQSDSRVRVVTLQPLSPLQSATSFRLAFQFTEFHDFDWLLLNEVEFCSETQQLNTTPSPMFTAPLSLTHQPSAEDLRTGSTELICSLSSEGLYSWTWERDNSVLDTRDSNYTITVGDGSRTTRLIISSLDFSSAGQYTCNCTSVYSQQKISLALEVQFPEILVSPPTVSGYEQATVIVSCELSGYQSVFSPPMWMANGSELITSHKHTLNHSEGVHTIVLENGSVLASLIVSLTIYNLSMADEGRYTCHGAHRESETQLTVLPLPLSPSTIDPTLLFTVAPVPPTRPSIVAPVPPTRPSIVGAVPSSIVGAVPSFIVGAVPSSIVGAVPSSIVGAVPSSIVAPVPPIGPSTAVLVHMTLRLSSPAASIAESLSSATATPASSVVSATFVSLQSGVVDASPTPMLTTAVYQPVPPTPSPAFAVVAVVMIVVMCGVVGSLVLIVWYMRRRSKRTRITLESDNGHMTLESEGDDGHMTRDSEGFNGHMTRDSEGVSGHMTHESKGGDGHMTQEMADQFTVCPVLDSDAGQDVTKSTSGPVYKIVNHNVDGSEKNTFDQSAIFFYSTDL